jgi:ABC-type molybdate transport system substrate-binding protein
MKKTGIIYLAAALFYLGIASFAFAGSKEITISAGMSLKNAFEEIGKRFESNTKNVCVFKIEAYCCITANNYQTIEFAV